MPTRAPAPAGWAWELVGAWPLRAVAMAPVMSTITLLSFSVDRGRDVNIELKNAETPSVFIIATSIGRAHPSHTESRAPSDDLLR
jgi:hypothetical protein